MPGQDALEFDPGRVVSRGAADTRTAPGIFDFNWDSTKASAEDAYYDVPGRARERRGSDLAHAAAELARATGKRPDYYYVTIPGEPGGIAPEVDEDRFWADRARRPDLLKDLGKDRADYDKRRVAALQQGAQDRAARLAQGGLAGNLLGGAVGAFTDPINVITAPLGGGGGSGVLAAAKSIVMNGVINAGVETLEQPLIDVERVEQGRPAMTGEERAMRIGGAFIGGAGLDAAGRLIPPAARAIGAGVNRVFDLDDRALARALRQAAPDHALTPDQAAALHVLDRSIEIDDSNPFVRTYENLDAHAAKVEQLVRDFSAPVDVAPARAPSIAGGVASPAAPVASGYNPAQLKGLIRGPESGGNDGAVNGLGSSASGRYQFVKGTFESVYAKAYGVDKAAAAEAWKTRRFDPAVQERLMDRLMADNAAVLQRAGIPVDNGNMYVMHVLGARNGPKLLRAASDTPAADLLSATIVRQNPGYFGGGKTVGQALDIIRGKVGGEPGPARAGGIGDGEIDGAGPPARSPDLDAERPGVDLPELDDIDAGLPVLRRDQFANDDSWQIAQRALDEEALGITAFHGSPHRFDRFSLNRIGSGEGAQAFGHGLYFTDTREIADFYRDLADDTKINGREMNWDEAGAYNEWRDSGKDIDRAIAGVQEMIADRRASGELRSFDGYEKRLGVLRAWKRAMPDIEQGGHLYEVKLPPADGFLLWDKGLGEQSPRVRGALSSVLDKGDLRADATGRDLYELLANRTGERDDRIASKVLHDAGLAGIKYLDGNSRQIGEGSANYVVFDDAAAKITAVNDEPVPSAALDQLAAQGELPFVHDAAAAAKFDDPRGAEIAAMAEGAWHDLLRDAELNDPGSVGKFDLGDGVERSIAEIRAELDRDAADIDAIDACRKPPAAGGEA